MFCYHLVFGLDVLLHTYSGSKVQRTEYKNRKFKWKMCACVRYLRMRSEMSEARERVPQFCQNRFVLLFISASRFSTKY